MIAAEGVDGDGDVGALDVFEEKGAPAEGAGDGAVFFVMAVRSGGFADAVADFGDLENRIDLSLDSNQLALCFQELNKFRKCGCAHEDLNRSRSARQNNFRRFKIAGDH